MIEIKFDNDVSPIINKGIVIQKFGKVCNELGFDVDRYIVTEYLENEKPYSYKIKFLHSKKIKEYKVS